MKHELKIKPEYFSAVVTGEKTFEIRNNADRNFQVGDTLILKSWDGEFNGNYVERTVSYITDFEQKPDYVVLGLANTREQELAEQLADATRQCGVMAELLREAIGEVPQTQSFPSRCDTALAGKMPEQRITKPARIGGVVFQPGNKASYVIEAAYLAADHHEPNPAAFQKLQDAMLAGLEPAPDVTVTETIRTAPDRIWLQVGDQGHYHSEPFPSDTLGVSWCAESVVACEVPYVRADLVGQVPAPVSGEKRTITINGKGLLELVDFTCPDHETDLEQQETEIVLLNRGAFTSTDGEEMPAGVYAYLAEYPEEGLHGPIGGAA